MIGRLARFISSSCLQFTIETGQYVGHHRTDALAFNGMESLAIPWKETGCHKEEYLVNDTSIAKLDMVYFGKVKLVLMFLKDVNHYWVGIFLHLPVRVSVAPVKAVVSGFETTPPSLEGSGNSSAGGVPGLVLDHITPPAHPPAHHNNNQKIADNHQRLIKKPFCFGILESWSPSQWWIPPEQLESVERNVCNPKIWKNPCYYFFNWYRKQIWILSEFEWKPRFKPGWNCSCRWEIGVKWFWWWSWWQGQHSWWLSLFL